MKTIRLNTFAAVATVLAASAPLPSHAAEPMNKMDKKTAASDASVTMTEGEVRKIDKEAGKITLKHGPITNLQMPGMTMTFRVVDPALLDQVKVGNKVKFHVENGNGTLTVTAIKPE